MSRPELPEPTGFRRGDWVAVPRRNKMGEFEWRPAKIANTPGPHDVMIRVARLAGRAGVVTDYVDPSYVHRIYWEDKDDDGKKWHFVSEQLGS